MDLTTLPSMSVWPQPLYASKQHLLQLNILVLWGTTFKNKPCWHIVKVLCKCLHDNHPKRDCESQGVGGREKESPVGSFSFRQCQVTAHLFRFSFSHMHVGGPPHPTPDSHVCISFYLSLAWAPGLVAKRLLNPRPPFGPGPRLAAGEMRDGRRRGLGRGSTLFLVLPGSLCRTPWSPPFLSTTCSPCSVAKRPACCLQAPWWWRLHNL